MKPRTSTRVVLFALVGAALAAGCRECEPPLVVIAPAIAVDVCRDPKLELSGRLLGGVRDCSVAFGLKDLSVRHELEIRVSNPSPIELTLFDVSFAQGSDPAFRVEHAPETIGEGLTSVLVVSFRPLVEGEVRGTLVIKSDAENLAEGEDVIIHLTGTGIDNGVPDIHLSPLECAFGRVAVGSVKQCTLTIENRGQRDLVFDEVAVEPASLQIPAGSEGDSFGFAGRAPSPRDHIPPGAGQNVVNLTVRFTPDVLGNYFGRLRFLTNDPDAPVIVVPLTGVGVDPPLCRARIQSVNDVPAGANPTVEPLDHVVLTVEDSEPSTPNGSITQVEWRLLQQPPSSTVVLTNPTGFTTGFTFANGVLGVDLAGRYKVRATVIDDLGTRSANQCEVEFEAIPTDTILTQLSWDTHFGDMDLHLIKMDTQGRYCGASAASPGPRARDCGHTNSVCYYANCKQSMSSRPDWDADSVNGSVGDPSLDIDDLCGYGPENITIDTAPPGKYLVGVHFFGFTGCSGSGNVGNTLRIYLYGQLVAEFYKELTLREWWEVAVIHWPGANNGVPCIEDLSTPESECAG